MSEKVIRNSVKSSNIAAIGWHKNLGDAGHVHGGDILGSLYVEFTGGKIYIYHNVPEHIFKVSLGQKSIGSFFAKSIKNNYQWIAFTGHRDELFLTPTEEQAV